jgi:hypothetical protein
MQVRRATSVGLRPEAHRQVHHRHHGAAQVDHAAHQVGHHRHLGELAVFDDLLDAADADGEGFAAQREHQVLLRLRGDGKPGGRPPRRYAPTRAPPESCVWVMAASAQ